MRLLRARLLPFSVALLSTACVAKDAGLLGDLEPDAASSGGDTSDPTAGDDGGTCPNPAHSYHVPWTEACADPVIPLLPAAGCYETCQGPEAVCTVGVCTQVQTQLDCDDHDTPCCGAIVQLCLGDSPDRVCDAIVGTTFSSVERTACYPGREGEKVPLCHAWVVFEEDGSFQWMDGDFGLGGTYACEGGVLELDLPEVEFSFDLATSILTWDGREYVPDPTCEQIVGTTYLSVEELECGLGPDGPVLCNWQVTFEEDGDYLWTYSDVGEGGTYTCQGGNILVSGGNVDVDLDPATGILTWDGVDYVAAP